MSQSETDKIRNLLGGRATGQMAAKVGYVYAMLEQIEREVTRISRTHAVGDMVKEDLDRIHELAQRGLDEVRQILAYGNKPVTRG
jgi:hypothetical protein